MNPLVELRSVGGPQLWPTRKQKELAEQDIVSLYRARLEGFQRDLIQRLQAAGVLRSGSVQEKSAEGTSQAGGAGSVPSQSSMVSRAGGELGKDAFLQLLVTQMQYQDPLSPMDNTDMIAQLAQFSALEQMNNLNSTTQSGLGQLSQQMTMLGLLGAQNLIGRVVSGVVADTGAAVNGRVAGVSLEDNTVLLTLEDGTKFPVSGITGIRGDGESAKSVASAAPGTVATPVQAVPVVPVTAVPVAAGVDSGESVINPDVTELVVETSPIDGGA